MRQLPRRKPIKGKVVMLVCYALVVVMGLLLYARVDDYTPRGLKPPVPQAVATFDVTSLPPCPGEAGPVNRTPRLACTWDAATQGTVGPRLYDARWLVYLPTCPAPFDTVQNRALVQCIEMSDWGE